MNISFFDQIYNHQNIDSTFSEAKKLLAAKKNVGNFIVIASSQTEGIGRKGNQWHSPEGGLWFTAGLFNLPVKNCITIFTALMIIRAIVKLYPNTEDYVGLKWPNDIVLDGKKLGGILTSFFPLHKYLLIGVGINTNNDSFPEGMPAISLNSFLNEHHLKIKSTKMINNERVLNEIFKQFGEQLPIFIESDLKSYLNDYYLYSTLEGKRITLATEFQDYVGVVKGINQEGALMLQLPGGSIQPFLSGSVVDGYK